jgi:DNA-binding transcriptional MerR regulator
VHRLVKEQGFTIAGAKQKLKTNKETVVQNEEIVRRLKFVRSELTAMKDEIEETEKHIF